MNRKELREAIREDLDDLAKPYLWSDAFLNRALDEAESEACRRARLIVDSSDSAVCRIATTLNENTYDLDDRIIFVRRVLSSGRTTPLRKISYKDLDGRYPGWESQTGAISHYCLDFTTGKLVTDRKPTASEVVTLSLTVVRTPLKGLETDGAEPEIKPRYHFSLRHYAVFLAYMKPDEDTYRPDKAKMAEALFTQEFGKKSDAKDEAWIEREHGYDQDEGLD
jgi:hypothetical protein